ncbi:4566_t:CDS:2, partial [Funneliformis geosporum]
EIGATFLMLEQKICLISRNTEYNSDVVVEPRQPRQSWQPGQQQFGPGPGLGRRRHEFIGNGTAAMIAMFYLRNNQIPAPNRQNARM